MYKKKVLVPYELVCSFCNKEYTHKSSLSKYCSKECMAEKLRISTGANITDEYPKIKKMSVWKISEILVSVDLMQKGYDVFTASSPSTYCDILAKKPGCKIIEVEVRSGYFGESGKLSFSKGLRDSANCYAVFVRNTKAVHYLDKNCKKINI